MNTKTSLWGVVALLTLFAMLGCDPPKVGASSASSAAAAKKKRTGGYVRLVNLSDTTVNAEYADRALGNGIKGGMATAFALSRPQKTEMILKVRGKDDIKYPFEIKGQGATHSFYVLEGPKGLELRLVEGDPYTPEGGGVAANVVNLTQSPAEVVVNAGKSMSVDKGKNQDIENVAVGSVNLETAIGGRKLELVSQDTKDKEAYSFVIHMKDGKPQVKAIHNNPPMQFSMSGSSAAG